MREVAALFSPLAVLRVAVLRLLQRLGQAQGGRTRCLGGKAQRQSQGGYDQPAHSHCTIL